MQPQSGINLLTLFSSFLRYPDIPVLSYLTVLQSDWQGLPVHDADEFAWSKAVYIESRIFAATKEQCDKLYQRCIKSELYKHIITCNTLLKMAEEDNITDINMNDFSPKQINAITNYLLDKPDGYFNVDEIATLLFEFHTYLTSGKYLGPNLLYKTSITETDIKDTMTAFENFLVKHDIKTFRDVWTQFGF